MAATPYDHQFYEEQRLGSQQSADVIVPLIMAEFEVASVVDVGCGVGPWLKAFSDCGVGDVTGLDGDYVNRADLVIPSDRFQPTDLTSNFSIARRYDLACSLEVAEHLHPALGPRLISKLCGAAPVVLFSAAIPGQSGTNHVNEAWQDYWRGLFAEHGYFPVDMIRPKVWGNATVKWWYQQNIVVYVDAATRRGHPHLEVVDSNLSLNQVHPDCYMKHVDASTMYLSKALRQLPGHVVAAVKRRIGKT